MEEISEAVEVELTSKEEEGPQPDEEGLYLHHRLVSAPGQRVMRVDQYLVTLLANVSRTRIKNASKAGCVKVNDKIVKASYKVKPHDVVTFLLPHPPAPEVTPEEMPLDIIYEDDDIAVVNKAPGVVVHPGIGHWSGTLIHGLLWYFNKDRLDQPKEEWIRPLLVHRIDKDTSGLILVAKNEYANAFCAKQFFNRTTDRLYEALTWGDIKDDYGRIEGHVGRSVKDRKKFYIYADGSAGKHAVTHWKALERFRFVTLVQCKLETGRTHQIRVHLKYVGHRLFSDSFYNGDRIHCRLETPRYDSFINNCLKEMPRQALHAKTLGFEHPNGKRMHFECELPADFAGVLEKMRKYRDTYLS